MWRPPPGVCTYVHSEFALAGDVPGGRVPNLMGWTPPDSLYGKVEVLKHH